MAKTQKKIHEKFSRSLLKSLTWRLIVIVSDIVVVYTLTHSSGVTFGVVVFTNLSSTLLYIFHERVWNVIGWGRTVK